MCWFPDGYRPELGMFLGPDEEGGGELGEEIVVRKRLSGIGKENDSQLRGRNDDDGLIKFFASAAGQRHLRCVSSCMEVSSHPLFWILPPYDMKAQRQQGKRRRVQSEKL